MRKRLLSILLLGTLVLAVTAITVSNWDTAAPFHVLVSGEEEISCWADNDGQLYVFLPGYAEPDDGEIVMDSASKVRIGSTVLHDGMTCGVFEPGVPYDLQWGPGGTRKRTVTFMISGAVPALYIDTETGSMKAIHSKKGHAESGTMRLYALDGEGGYTGKVASIKGRGNTSWTDAEKKPYTLQLETAADLLGMGEAQKWILLANAGDATHMRNKIVLDFAGGLALPYTPASQWVDLYLNGCYAGLYLLCEKIEVHPERVDLNTESGVLLSLEARGRLEEENIPFASIESRVAFRIHYPEQDPEAAAETVSRMLQSIDNAIRSGNDTDILTGKKLWELIDVESWVLNYLIDEVFGNRDGFRASRYFYADIGDADGRVYAGPVWDYDKSMGCEQKNFESVSNPETLILNRYHGSAVASSFWVGELYEKDWFRDELARVFSEQFLPELDLFLQSHIGLWSEQIRCAAAMDARRWGRGTDMTFDEETGRLRRFLQTHASFLQRVWSGDTEYHRVTLIKSDGHYFYSVAAGEAASVIDEIAETDEAERSSWYYSGSREPFDIRKAITEDVEIIAPGKLPEERQTDRVIKLVPLGVIAVMGMLLLAVELRRMWKYR